MREIFDGTALPTSSFSISIQMVFVQAYSLPKLRLKLR